MSSGTRARYAAAASETLVVRIWRWEGHVFYGKIEWQRLCSLMDVDEKEGIVRFRTEMALSPYMVQLCNVVFDSDPFPVRGMQLIGFGTKAITDFRWTRHCMIVKAKLYATDAKYVKRGICLRTFLTECF
ncbi:hypothetical protein PsorP6_012118 [Peronosclerospora sorghi]|uniref:Uncharacterized protein n=1 Tax=Peronosclerospora sorghi TaxID=230839 RepID=A0ACC0WIB6_9STRA|nr:hypothetical protein PsorP6_012118 [Peronosclerospora sorghi]